MKERLSKNGSPLPTETLAPREAPPAMAKRRTLRTGLKLGFLAYGAGDVDNAYGMGDVDN